MKRLGYNDRYEGLEYQRQVAQYAAYKDLSARIEELFGPALMDPSAGLFTSFKAHVGSNPAIHVPIHELMSSLSLLAAQSLRLSNREER